VYCIEQCACLLSRPSRSSSCTCGVHYSLDFGEGFEGGPVLNIVQSDKPVDWGGGQRQTCMDSNNLL
jgi:hypothetical protein